MLGPPRPHPTSNNGPLSTEGKSVGEASTDLRRQASLARTEELWPIGLRIPEVQELLGLQQEIESLPDVGVLSLIGELIDDPLA